MKLRNIIRLVLLAILLSGVGFVGLVIWSVYKVHEALIGPEILYQLENRPEDTTY
jgi:hypothetical protein